MNTRKWLLALPTMLLFGSAAWADRPHHWNHPRHESHTRFGIVIGSPFWGPWGYPPPSYYYYPRPYSPTIIVEQPPVYIERPAPAAPVPAPTQSFWYYCAAANGYYPYVNQCPGGWARVPAQPPTP